jgi:hypothetical protein
MIIMPDIFERLCLRIKADHEIAAMREPIIDSATAGHEADEARETQDGAAPEQPSTKQEEQICIPQGMLSFANGHSSKWFISIFH